MWWCKVCVMNTSSLRGAWVRCFAALVVLATMCMLVACGFQPRASTPAYAFTAVGADIARTAQTAKLLRQRMQAGGKVRFYPVTMPDDAEKGKGVDVVLQVLRDDRGTIIRGQNASGEIRELSLVRRFYFRLLKPDGSVLLDTVKLQTERDTSYSEEEEVTRRDDREVLYREMAEDLARQAEYRLSAVSM